MIDAKLKNRLRCELINSTGNVTLAIQSLKLEDKQKEYELRKWLKDDADVADMVKILRFDFGDKLTDAAVLKFAEDVQAGDKRAIENLLFKSVYGRERGFGESINVNLAGQETGIPIIVYHEVKEKINGKISDTQPDTSETERVPAS